MDILDYIYILNWKVINEYNEFKNLNLEALKQWLQNRYNPRSIIPLKYVTLFDNVDKEYKEFCLLNKKGYSREVDKLSYKEKKFIIEHKVLILKCYKYFNYYLNIYKTFESKNFTSPLTVRYLAEKYLRIGLNGSHEERNLANDVKGICVTYPELLLNSGISTTINSIEELTIDQKEVILNHSEEFQAISIEINKRIVECRLKKINELIHKRFIKEVLNHPRRSKYYLSFFEKWNLDPEQYGREHIQHLDSRIVEILFYLDTYIEQTLKSKYNEIKKLYPIGIAQYDIDNQFPIERNLSDIDYWEDCINNEELIKKYNSIGIRYNELFNKYPKGITEYKDSHKTFDDNICIYVYPSKEEIINLGEEKLAYYEKLSAQIQTYNKWEIGQEEFSIRSRNEHDTYFKGWGCYLYNIPFEYPSFTNAPGKIHLKVWQHFINSYCVNKDLDYKYNPEQKNRYEVKIPQFKNRTLHYTVNVYNKILAYIYALKEHYGSLLVLFGDSGLHDPIFDEYHYNYVKQQLSINHILYGSELINCQYQLLYKNIVIIELITSNDNLKKQCSEIYNTFKATSPNIIYISLNKEYDKDEMSEIIKSTYEAKKKEEEERARKEKEEIERREAEKLQNLKVIQEKTRLFGCVSNWYSPSKSSLKCFSMYYYYPPKCDFEANKDEWEIRNLIWNFKASPNKPMSEFLITTLHEIAAEKVVDEMQRCLTNFFGDDVKLLTLVCIPSSKREITKKRYEDFSTLICERLYMENAYQHVYITKDGEAKHNGGSIMAQYDFDEAYFKDKYVILFDDVITSGSSMEQFRRRLEKLGATVIGGFSIGKTKHERQGANPIEELEKYTYTEEDENCDLLF